MLNASTEAAQTREIATLRPKWGVRYVLTLGAASFGVSALVFDARFTVIAVQVAGWAAATWLSVIRVSPTHVAREWTPFHTSVVDLDALVAVDIERRESGKILPMCLVLRDGEGRELAIQLWYWSGLPELRSALSCRPHVESLSSSAKSSQRLARFMQP